MSGWGAAVAAALNIGGGAIDRDGAMNDWRDQNAINAGQNEGMAINNQARNKDMWDYTNYENQVKHAKAAGLSIGSIFGGGGAGGTTASGGNGGSGAGGGSYALQGTRLGEAAMAGMAMEAEVKLKEAQAKNLDADTAKKTGVDTDKTKADTDFVNTSTEMKKLEILESDLSREDRMYEIQMNAQTAYEKTISAGVKSNIDVQTKDAQIELIRETAIGAAVQNNLNNMRIAETAAEIDKIKEVTKEVIARVQQNNRDLDRRELEYELEKEYKALGLKFNYIKLAAETATDAAGIITRTGGSNRDRSQRDKHESQRSEDRRYETESRNERPYNRR